MTLCATLITSKLIYPWLPDHNYQVMGTAGDHDGPSMVTSLDNVLVVLCNHPSDYGEH